MNSALQLLFNNRKILLEEQYIPWKKELLFWSSCFLKGIQFRAGVSQFSEQDFPVQEIKHHYLEIKAA